MSHMQRQDRSWERKPYQSCDMPYERSRNWRGSASRSGSNSTSSGEERRRGRFADSYSNKRSLSPSSPDSNSRVGNSKSRRDSRLETSPFSRSVSAAPQPHEVVAGIIMDFPAHFEIGKHSPSKKLREQLWVNKHATGHPVLVWDTYSSDGVQYARCLPMTSLAGKTPEEKYPYAWKHHVRYVPISQGGKVTNSRTHMPTLALTENGTMKQQTYVHLDHFFEIEVEHLLPRGSRDDPSKPLRLDDAALNVLLFKLGQFIQGDIWRPAPVGDIKSPLDYQSLPDPKLGRPILEGKLEERALAGAKLEAARHEKAGTREWTGLERGEFPPRGPWEESVEAPVTPSRNWNGNDASSWARVQFSYSHSGW